MAPLVPTAAQAAAFEAAIVAMFRLKVGIFATLGAASVTGIVLHFAGLLAKF